MSVQNDEIPLKLHCLGGREPPDEVASDLRLIKEFPPRALTSLWRILGPCITADPEANATVLDQRLEEMRRESGIAAGDLTRVLRSARFLLREAARLNIDKAQFELDMNAILESTESAAASALLSGYEAAMSELRAEIIEGTLADHGKVLVDVDWRVDTLATSSRGVKLATPVVVLTLRYQEGERRERITLQALPGVLEELRRICDHILE